MTVPPSDSSVSDSSGPSPETDSASEPPVPDSPEPAFTDEWSIRRIVRTMVPLLAALSVLQLVSGTVLETYEETLVRNPALLVLVPVQIGTAGNLASITCSRLTTQLHLGTYELSPTNPDLRANASAVFALAGTVFGVVGVAAWAIGVALGGTLELGRVLLISLVSGMLLAVLVVITSVAAVEASYRVGLNPDDTTIPVVTNVCDIAGVLILFAVVSVVV
ncbi:magnesium transporter [Halorubrum trueperi]